jgi:4-amino-4-deoxy-L-arabinose transferase-like glycosyltransferase
MSKVKRRVARPSEGPAAPAVKAPARRPVSTDAFLWIGLALLVLTLIVRLRLLDLPFERDEAAFAYIGRALWGGERLYTDLYDNKLPGLYLIYALFGRLFGVQPAGIHLGALLWHGATLAVLFLWLREVWGRPRALACTGLYALYAAAGEVMGFAAHATQLTALPAFAGLWALWRGTVQGKAPQAMWFFLAGLGAGLAFWIKQQAFFYAVFGAIFWAWWFFAAGRPAPRGRALGMGALYALGVLLPVGLSAAWFAAQGRFDDFWFWTVQISSQQTIQSTNGGFFFKHYFPQVSRHWWWVWLAGLGGFMWLVRQRESTALRQLALLFPLSLLGTSLGGAFYPHYFVLTLPWLAFCAVAGLEALVRRSGTVGWAATALVLAWPVLAHSAYWLSEDDRTTIRRVYDNNPFTEMAVIGAELKKRSAPTDSIAIIGSEPEVFLYADRPSALSHLFFQGVVQQHPRREQFQQQVRQEFYGRPPRFVVLPGAQYEHIKDDPLVRQIVADLQKDYRTIGVVDIYDKKSQFIWDPPPEKAVPQTLFWIMVLERK